MSMKSLVLAIVGLASSSVFAGDLRNADSVSYNIKVSCGAGSTSTSIGSNTTQSSGAKKGCTIEGPWGKFKVEGDKGAEIKNGKISEKK
ncbi:MAG: hypothetical protein NT027_09090 [Proteobacteria bacterium]|nr:hypothetical protein [Pseudomonadota bacterium]